jgi:hypothetical protein
MLRAASNDFAATQAPIFISVTANNDWATGLAFPIGMAISAFGESVRNWRQRQAVVSTMGHLGWMKTHDLSAAASAPRATLQVQGAGHPGQHGSATLTPVPSVPPGNPFWVVQATKQVVDGHTGIWGQVFVDWVFAEVAAHIAAAPAPPVVTPTLQPPLPLQ